MEKGIYFEKISPFLEEVDFALTKPKDSGKDKYLKLRKDFIGKIDAKKHAAFRACIADYKLNQRELQTSGLIDVATDGHGVVSSISQSGVASPGSEGDVKKLVSEIQELEQEGKATKRKRKSSN